MLCVVENARFSVYDDFLSKPDFVGLWRFVQAQQYHRVHAGGWQPVWRMHDGEPWSSSIVHSARSRHAERAERLSAGSALSVYPTGTHLDRLVEEICLNAGALEPLVGRQGRDWTIFTARAFLYPAGTGLGWHADANVFTGAFSFYAHPEWSSDWGGEILAADIPDGESAPYHLGPGPDSRAVTELLERRGLGDYVSPKPNRLIVLKAGTFHRINPVHPAAGSHVRCSIAGFFVRRTPEDDD